MAASAADHRLRCRTPKPAARIRVELARLPSHWTVNTGRTGNALRRGRRTQLTQHLPLDRCRRPARPHVPRVAAGKILVIGLGNPLISDDSVGLRVADRLKQRLAGRPRIVVTEDYWGGLRLMERMIGYDAAIVVDAICTGATPGTIHHFAYTRWPRRRALRRTM